MALYTYTCKVCGWTGDRIAPMALRDALRCTQPAVKIEEDDAECRCDGELTREEIALNAKMAHFWMP